MIDFAKRIAVEAGRIALEEYENIGRSGIIFKSEKDIVTSADRKVEEYLIGEIAREFPGHGIYAEETGRSGAGSRHCWVIDPIDGTTSFVHDQPYFSVSIAYKEGGEARLGVVNAPRLNELYWAEKGGGAFCNGRRIKVSSRDKLINSVLATGFACVRSDLPKNNLEYFCRILPKLRGIRRYGSAAIDLSYVACGRLEGFWELNLKEYDIAAGAVILEEAGGSVCDFNGGKNYPEDGTVATNGKIAEELIANFR